MKRILYISQKPVVPILDGGTRAMALFFEVLRACKGVEITYMPIVTPKHALFKNPSSEKKMKMIPLHVSTDITFSKILRFFSKSPANAIRFSDDKSQKVLAEIILQSNFDAVICDGFYALSLLSNELIKNQKVIYRCHNIETNYWKLKAKNDQFWLAPLHRGIVRKMLEYEKEKVALASAVFSISNNELNHIKTWNCNSHLLYPQVSLQVLEKKPRGDENPSIGFVGDMNWLPNKTALNRFIKRVWPKFRLQFPKVQLTVAGQGTLCYSNDKMGIKGLGFVENLHEFFQLQHFLINPVFEGTGFNMKLLDALNYQKPMVIYSTRLDGLEAAPCFLAARNDAEFLTSMQKLMESEPDFTERTKCFSKVIQEHFAFSDKVQQLEKILHG